MLARSALLALLLVTVPAQADHRAPAGNSLLERPVTTAWRGARAWDAAAEVAYGDFVAAIGRGAAAGHCHTLAACLNDPRVNPLLARGDQPLRMHADCADVPYMLRAYFALHHDLPFVWAAGMQGRGRDSRYLREAHPEGLRTWQAFKTAHRLMDHIGGEVNSGWFRSAPDVEATDTYPVRATRAAIRPGTMFYDPNGHVLMVWDVRADGDVMLFDGHPDGSLTHKHLTAEQVVGGPRQGGGFRNFRPLVVSAGQIVFEKNADLPDLERRQQGAGRGRQSFADWVRSMLALPHHTPART